MLLLPPRFRLSSPNPFRLLIPDRLSLLSPKPTRSLRLSQSTRKRRQSFVTRFTLSAMNVAQRTASPYQSVRPNLSQVIN